MSILEDVDRGSLHLDKLMHNMVLKRDNPNATLLSRPLALR